jgi:Lipase (class 3)
MYNRQKVKNQNGCHFHFGNITSHMSTTSSILIRRFFIPACAHPTKLTAKNRCFRPLALTSIMIALTGIHSGCRTHDSSQLAATGPSAPTSDSVLYRKKVRSVASLGVCASRNFVTDTDVIVVVDPNDGNVKTEKTAFSVSDSIPATNGYWLSLASALANNPESATRGEFEKFWGADSLTYIVKKEGGHPPTDTQVVVMGVKHQPKLDIASKNIDIGFDVIKTEAHQSVEDVTIVSFSGSDFSTSADFWTDIANAAVPLKARNGASLGQVHEGFRKAAMSVYPEVLAQIKKLRRPVFLTGHSLGAGVATIITALLLAENDPDIKIVALYTYGSPMVGLGDFVSNFDKLAAKNALKVRRYVNQDDAVARIPDTFTGLFGGSVAHIIGGGWKPIGENPKYDSALLWYAPNSWLPYSRSEAENRMATSLWTISLGPEWWKDHYPANYIVRGELSAFASRTLCPGDHGSAASL